MYLSSDTGTRSKFLCIRKVGEKKNTRNNCFQLYCIPIEKELFIALSHDENLSKFEIVELLISQVRQDKTGSKKVV